MKKLWCGLVTAFSMYSALPMPQVEWTGDSMKYALCFFPAVGAAVGAFCWLWGWLCGIWALSGWLFAAGMVLIPLLVTGGIHLDGFVDTSDGLHSHLEAARKLEILKDPHIGAFGVIRCGMYLVALFALAGALSENPAALPVYALGFMTARGFSAFAIVTFPAAKNTGLARLFADNASKKTVRVVAVLVVLLGFVGMAYWNLWLGVGTAAASLLLYFWFYRMSRREFGGITGDLAGYLVCLLELLYLAAAVLGGILA
ncbi:MAG: adenosylcobinamide-GDP ribazoletransferase [Candidatus Merdivicinus sp.]